MTTTQWVNTEPDEGALHALLGRLATRLPVDSIDELWIFPTRRAGGFESTVLVAATIDDDPERRRVSTARFIVSRDRKGRPTISEEMREHGSAPVDAVERVVQGVVRRLGDDAIQPPRAVEIAGDPARWHALISELGGSPADPADPEQPPPSDVGGSPGNEGPPEPDPATNAWPSEPGGSGEAETRPAPDAAKNAWPPEPGGSAQEEERPAPDAATNAWPWPQP